MFDHFSIRSGNLAFFHDLELEFDWLDEMPVYKLSLRRRPESIKINGLGTGLRRLTGD